MVMICKIYFRILNSLYPKFLSVQSWSSCIASCLGFIVYWWLRSPSLIFFWQIHSLVLKKKGTKLNKKAQNHWKHKDIKEEVITHKKKKICTRIDNRRNIYHLDENQIFAKTCITKACTTGDSCANKQENGDL